MLIPILNYSDTYNRTGLHHEHPGQPDELPGQRPPNPAQRHGREQPAPHPGHPWPHPCPRDQQVSGY